MLFLFLDMIYNNEKKYSILTLFKDLGRDVTATNHSLCLH